MPPVSRERGDYTLGGILRSMANACTKLLTDCDMAFASAGLARFIWLAKIVIADSIAVSIFILSH